MYNGRLMADGEGNLLADQSKNVGTKVVTLTDDSNNAVLDGAGNVIQVSVPIFEFGPDHGKPVAFHEGSYVFLKAGELSHNDRHHQQFAVVHGTLDPDSLSDSDIVAALEEKGASVNPEDHAHHNEVLGEKAKLIPDAISAVSTGHTEAYTNGS